MSSLKSRAQFDRVSREGKRIGRDFLQLRILPNSLKSNRLGIAIPVKAVRKAVDRNRIRRLVRESFRSMSDSIQAGFDIVIMVRGKPPVNQMQCVRDEIFKLLDSQGMIIKDS